MIRIQNLDFTYDGSDFRLSFDSLSVDVGEAVAFVGPSGSGKTTLLHLIAGICTPNQGRLTVDGLDINLLSEASRRHYRIENIGMVFQEFELLEHLSVLDNMLLAYRISPALTINRETCDRAAELADSVGIGDKLKRSVGCLSQGERQRVAVCRALLTRPKILLADEPTGNLDPTNKERILDVLFDYAEGAGATLVTVTHDHDLLDRFDRSIDFREFHATAESITRAEEKVL